MVWSESSFVPSCSLNGKTIVVKVLSFCSFGKSSESLSRGRIISFLKWVVDEVVGFFMVLPLMANAGRGWL